MQCTVIGCDDRRLMRPELEETPLFPEERVQESGVEWAEPAEDHQQVVAGDNRRWVELQAPECEHQVMDVVSCDR